MDTKNLYINVMEFIHLENDFLDHHQYQDWLKLWDEKGLYIVPVKLDSDDYANQVNYAYDDHTMRKMRIARLTSGESISVETHGGTVRLVSRLRILNCDDNEVVARCSLQINENRRGDVKSFIANVDYTLRLQNDTFLLKQKVVKFINAEDYLRSISYLV